MIKTFNSIGLLITLVGFLHSILAFSNSELDSIHTNKFEKETQTCQEILKELGQASGLSPIEMPDIEVVEQLDNTSLAIAMYKNQKIQIHQFTYEICMQSLGKDSLNGLAFIIAHELTHILEKHIDRPVYIQEKELTEDQSFIQRTRRMVQNQNDQDNTIQQYAEIIKNYNTRKNEAEADLHAGIVAYLAGYETRDIASTFFDTAYVSFQLDSEGLEGKYPSLHERKQIAKRSSKKLDTLIQVFEIANLLVMGGQYEMATNCYKYINQFYSSPALLNNIGLSLILETMDANSSIYNLPFTINTSFTTKRTLLAPETGGGIIGRVAGTMEIYDKLTEAISYFDRIQVNHPKNYESYLNESIAYFLNSDLATSIYQYLNSFIDIHVHRKTVDYQSAYLMHSRSAALKAKQIIETSRLVNDKALSDIYCMSAIIEHADSNYLQAKAYMAEASFHDPDSDLLLLNQHISNDTIAAETVSDSLKNTSNSKRDFIHEPTLENQYQLLDGQWDLDLTLGPIACKMKALQNGIFYSAAYIPTDRPKEEQFIAYAYNSTLENRTEDGFKAGDNWQEIKQVYGQQPKSIQDSAGSFYNYHSDPEPLGDLNNYTTIYQVYNGRIFYIRNNILVKYYDYQSKELLPTSVVGFGY